MIRKDDSLQINTKELKQAVLLFRAINNRPRLRILKLIHQHQLISVTAIQQEMKVTQSFVSQQLGILRRAGLVGFHRKRQTVYYFVNLDELEKLSVAAKLIAG